ncbi:RNA polymerase I-specific transcription-initiation factor [Rhizoctonia solani]|uniref:RNA polymerase I-specific transcription-initiation factor n=1 Tax=Rhizoctonia solani TaxID=456999 RepID=A0A8H7IL90_9AGAM|nr:RNA polymerase I-specific transcription-initiation factor [Rhizoctonia solani]
MEGWPVDSRVQTPPETLAKRQGPRKVLPELNWDVPIIDIGTWSSSRLLSEEHKSLPRLSWANINSEGPRISTGNTRCIFPPTRDALSLADGLSFERRYSLQSREGVDDLEAIVLRELLEDDEKFAKAAATYNPYCSDLLAMDFLTKGHRKRAGIIAYPMGQSFDTLAGQLGASVLFDEKWGTVFSSGEQSGWKAPSSILQITNSNTIYKPDATTYANSGCLFAVRTLFDVHFVSISPRPGASVVAKQRVLSSFGRADIGNHRPFELVFNPHERSHAGLVVSDVGEVWSFGLDSKPSLLYTQIDDPITRVGAYDLPYWGLRWGYTQRPLCWTSTIASVLPVPQTVTSFDTIRNENFAQIFLSDMKYVSLVDERMLGRPIISWAHHRDGDMTLRIKAVELGQTEKVGLLTSKRSSFISVYDPVLSESGGLKGCDSYGLEWDSPNNCIPASIAVYIPPTTVRPTLFHLSNVGAIYRQDLAIGACEPSVERVVWEHELKNIAEKVELQHERYSKEDMAKCREVNVRNKYERIFMNSNTDLDGPSVAEIIDLAPTAFQRANEPIDRPMILHDLARVVPQETASVIPRSFFASTRSLPLPKARLLLRHTEHLRSQSQETRTRQRIGESFQKRQRSETRDSTGLGSINNCIFDCSLPTISAQAATCPVARDNDDMLSVAASALTLEGIEPPHVQHVQPCPTKGLVDGKKGAEQRQSLVARLLASEWDPDSSPGDYEFHDPYNQDYDEAMPAWKLMARTKADKELLEQAKSRLMSGRAAMAPVGSVLLPSVQISRTKPLAISNPVAVRVVRQVESQPELAAKQTASDQLGEATSSQMNGSSQAANTQVLPGPFGVRPGGSAAPKKKKSRLPGF